MLHKNLIRLVIVLALSLLSLGLYSTIADKPSSQLYAHVRYGADRAIAQIRWPVNSDGAYDIDEILDVNELVERLKSGPNFDWADWIDLDKTALFENGDLDPKLYPYLNELRPGERPAMPYEVKSPPQEQAMIGRLYCKWYLTSPFRIVPLENPGGFKKLNSSQSENLLLSESSLRTAPMTQYKAQHARVELRHRQHGHAKPTEYYEASPPLVSDLKRNVNELNQSDLLFPHISDDLFDWNIGDITKDIDTKNDGHSGQSHSITLQKSLQDARESPKYFHEVFISNDDAGYGVHYDWRFFRGILPHSERVAATHLLARAWQQFAEQMGITYWYAHGSLLSYYWNGIAMPWDADHDVQVPIKELDRLARDFNRTLVVQNSKEGFRKFLIDVTPYYADRKHGNGQNVIDARFIDVDTGTYIDITGLSRANHALRSVSCKNRHLYRASDFDRLRRTTFEGYPALVPLDLEKMLRSEYRDYSEPMYDSWKFNDKIRLWEFTKPCSEYLESFADPSRVLCFPEEVIYDATCKEEYGTCNRFLIREFRHIGHVTESHEAEMKLYKELGEVQKISDWQGYQDKLESLINLVGTYYRPFRNSTMLAVPRTSKANS